MTALCSGKICTIFPEKGALNFWKACTIALEYSLCEKTVTPHTFRHSVAMNLLISGVDISTIAIWLGHSSIETTHKYMIADMELKRKAMEKVGSAGNSSYKYKPSADIMNFLNSL